MKTAIPFAGLDRRIHSRKGTLEVTAEKEIAQSARLETTGEVALLARLSQLTDDAHPASQVASARGSRSPQLRLPFFFLKSLVRQSLLVSLLPSCIDSSRSTRQNLDRAQTNEAG